MALGDAAVGCITRERPKCTFRGSVSARARWVRRFPGGRFRFLRLVVAALRKKGDMNHSKAPLPSAR